MSLIAWASFGLRERLIDSGGGDGVASVWIESWAAMKAVTKVQTFQIIVLQGVVGSLPWTAMVFFTMWFELIGKRCRKSECLFPLPVSCCSEILLKKLGLEC